MHKLYIRFLSFNLNLMKQSCSEVLKNNNLVMKYCLNVSHILTFQTDRETSNFLHFCISSEKIQCFALNSILFILRVYAKNLKKMFRGRKNFSRRVSILKHPLYWGAVAEHFLFLLWSKAIVGTQPFLGSDPALLLYWAKIKLTFIYL